MINLDRPGDPSVFGEQTRAEAAELMARYPAGQSRSALLPMLHLVQSEQGYVSPTASRSAPTCSASPRRRSSAVATFYTMYKRKPTGEYLVSVCTNTLCGMLGGDEIFAVAARDARAWATTRPPPTARITLEHAECLAACDYAPVVTVNYEFFDNQTVDSARQLVERCKAASARHPPAVRRSARSSRSNARSPGSSPTRRSRWMRTAAALPTEVGVKLAIERGDTALVRREQLGARARRRLPRQAAAADELTRRAADDVPRTGKKG